MQLKPWHKVAVGGAAVLGAWTLWWRRMEPFTTVVDFGGQEVLVHAPEGLRQSAKKVTLYFHGNGAQIREVAGRLLPIYDASEPSLLVMPQLGAGGAPGGLGKGCRGLLEAILPNVGWTADGVDVALLSHSGGYLASSMALRANDLRVRGIGLFDSLYGQTDAFADAVRRGARLIDYYGPTTTSQSLALAAELGVTPNLNGYARTGCSGVEILKTNVFHENVPAEYLREVLGCFWG